MESLGQKCMELLWGGAAVNVSSMGKYVGFGKNSIRRGASGLGEVMEEERSTISRSEISLISLVS